MKRFFILSVAFLSLSLACTHSGTSLHTMGRFMPIDISSVTNRSFSSPWANQEEFGYRDWFKKSVHFQGIPFSLPEEGKVISLPPNQSVEIILDKPIKATEISFLGVA